MWVEEETRERKGFFLCQDADLVESSWTRGRLRNEDPTQYRILTDTTQLGQSDRALYISTRRTLDGRDRASPCTEQMTLKLQTGIEKWNSKEKHYVQINCSNSSFYGYGTQKCGSVVRNSPAALHFTLPLASFVIYDWFRRNHKNHDMNNA